MRRPSSSEDIRRSQEPQHDLGSESEAGDGVPPGESFELDPIVFEKGLEPARGDFESVLEVGLRLARGLDQRRASEREHQAVRKQDRDARTTQTR